VFKEECISCGTEYIRGFDIGGIGGKLTGRDCPKCGSHLRDCLLDWDSQLPELDLARAEEHSLRADLAICLGTTLRVQPASEIPLMTRGKLVVINLQRTTKDDVADLKINGRCDDVMLHLMSSLQLPIPLYNPTAGLDSTYNR